MIFQVLYSESNPKEMKSALFLETNMQGNDNFMACSIKIEKESFIITFKANGDFKKYKLQNINLQIDELPIFKNSKFGFGVEVMKLPLLELRIGNKKIYIFDFDKPEETIKLRNKLEGIDKTPYTIPETIPDTKFTIFINLSMLIITILVIYWLLPDSIKNIFQINLYLYGSILLILSISLAYYFYKGFKEDRSKYESWIKENWRING